MEAKSTPSSPNVRRLRLFTILTVFLLLGVSIVSGEILVRILGAHQTWTEKNGGSYVSPYRQEFPRAWILDRGPNRILSYGQPEFDYEIRINLEGVRDVDHPVDKPAGEYRIVVLGDSWVEGQGASFEKTWPKILEENLNRHGFDRHIVVIMGGVAGSDPVFELELFRKRLQKYNPDMVIQAVNDSDITDMISRGGLDRFTADGMVKDRKAPTFEPLWARCRLFRVIMMDLLHYDWLLLSRNQQQAKTDEALDTIVEVAGAMSALAEAKGFNYFVIGHPQRNHFLYRGEYKIQPLESLLRGIGVDFVDIRPLVGAEFGADPSRIWDYFWKLDGHANEKGYELFARAVERKITPKLQAELAATAN
ncbi:MAG: SGNH/GDSL hydrolase family protein [Desulfomonile tiedjei]|uniref:SGNH/GDSL hydrolase family protein n=1 Tax=Desulfomonile tiedjei TaxID=2358 RepID=A0A9D6V0C5_9BACT|nr:SGNH/GDSL hydrolase family protein [Desulfomonile tiedjei]